MVPGRCQAPPGPPQALGSFNSPEHSTRGIVHILLHRGGNESQRKGAWTMLKINSSSLEFTKGRLWSSAWHSADRNDIEVSNTSIRTSENALAKSQGCVLYKRNSLSPKWLYCSHLI